MTVEIKPAKGTVNIHMDVHGHLCKHKVALKNALNGIGSEVVNLTSRYIHNGPKTGRVYNFRGSEHQASAPGESPASRTGRLARSGDYEVRNHQEMTVGLSEDYAKYLEDGTRRMKPRPSLGRAVRAKARDTERAILEAVQREIGA